MWQGSEAVVHRLVPCWAGRGQGCPLIIEEGLDARVFRAAQCLAFAKVPYANLDQGVKLGDLLKDVVEDRGMGPAKALIGFAQVCVGIELQYP